MNFAEFTAWQKPYCKERLKHRGLKHRQSEPFTMTTGQWRVWVLSQFGLNFEHTCYYCSRPISHRNPEYRLEDYHIQVRYAIKPIHGGSQDIDNAAILCVPCSREHAKTLFNSLGQFTVHCNHRKKQIQTAVDLRQDRQESVIDRLFR
jgi:hypothetical protein